MLAARMHAYHQPLVLEDVPEPEVQSDEILVKVKAAGMCRTDVQLLDGYFRKLCGVVFSTDARPRDCGRGSQDWGSDVSIGGNLRRETKWSAAGAMAPVVIVRKAIRRSAATGVGRGSGLMEATRNSCPSRPGISSK